MTKIIRKPIRAKKKFVVIAYDITSSKRRNKVMKILDKAGSRINFSVFECMLTDLQFKRVRKEIMDVIDTTEDKVIFYPICLKCYSKLIYQLPSAPSFEVVKVV